MIKTAFTPDDIRAFEPSEKIGIVSTVNRDGLPHITLLTSIMARGSGGLTIGEFCCGESKLHMEKNNNVGFAVITLDKRLWRGRAKWTRLAKEGPEYEIYNAQPMFRYNTYFGINTVHYLDLLEVTGGGKLPLASVVKSALLTKIAKGRARTRKEGRILKPFAERLFNNIASLSFLSYVDAERFPAVIPVLQCQAADSRRLAFHPGPFGKELREIKPGTPAAVYCLSMEMENVLTRGAFGGFRRYGGITLGTVDIDWVYNSMPSAHGQIYPEIKLEPVTEF